jgi:KDO2-lipid IV(A) lauroyltransferase
VAQVNSPASEFNELIKPRYWPIWVGIALFKSVSRLPLSARWRVGRWLGATGYYFARRRRHIVETNISLCYPQKSALDQRALVRDNFRSSGISLVETAYVWFSTPQRLAESQAIVDIEGLDYLQSAIAEGKGVLLLGMHLSTLDFCGALLGQVQPFDVMYRRNKNKLLEHIMTKGREQHFDSTIERREVRQVIRRLRQGAAVWYGPDQDYGRKHSVFAPFFGREAATITATARIVRMTNAAVITYSHFRNLETGRYRIVLSEPLRDFPVEDDVSNAKLVNQLVEAAINEAPEQYWWLHRRFKTTPEGTPPPY